MNQGNWGHRNEVGLPGLHASCPFLATRFESPIEKPHGVVGPQRPELKYSHETEESLLDVNCFLICIMGLTVSRPQVAPRMK